MVARQRLLPSSQPIPPKWDSRESIGRRAFSTPAALVAGPPLGVSLVRGILAAALAGVLAIVAATLMPSPAAALTPREIGWCVSALVQNPEGSACLAAIQSLRCSNLPKLY